MKIKNILFALAAALSFAVLSSGQTAQTDGNGLHIGASTSDRIIFYSIQPGVSQPTNASQQALTDSTGGTASQTLAAGVGVQTVALDFPSLVTITQAAAVATYTPSYNFAILSAAFVTTVPPTTASKALTFIPYIGTTSLSGGNVALTTATCTLGSNIAGTTVTASNTGTSAQAITITASSVTAFSQGGGYLLLTIQNLDQANAASSQAAQANALRSALVSLNLIKGQ